LLRVIEQEAPPKVVFKTKTYIDLYVRPDSTTEQRQTIINEWYRTELKKLIQPIIDKWEKQIGVSIADWQVKQMKTKWGTCNIEKRRIWINLDHNDRFLTLMEKYMPQWKFYKEELNRLPVSHGEWTY